MSLLVFAFVVVPALLLDMWLVLGFVVELDPLVVFEDSLTAVVEGCAVEAGIFVMLAPDPDEGWADTVPFAVPLLATLAVTRMPAQ